VLLEFNLINPEIEEMIKSVKCSYIKCQTKRFGTSYRGMVTASWWREYSPTHRPTKEDALKDAEWIKEFNERC